MSAIQPVIVFIEGQASEHYKRVDAYLFKRFGSVEALEVAASEGRFAKHEFKEEGSYVNEQYSLDGSPFARFVVEVGATGGTINCRSWVQEDEECKD